MLLANDDTEGSDTDVPLPGPCNETDINRSRSSYAPTVDADASSGSGPEPKWQKENLYSFAMDNKQFYIIYYNVDNAFPRKRVLTDRQTDKNFIIIIIMSAERRPLLDIGLPQGSPLRPVLCFRIHRDPAILTKSSLHLLVPPDHGWVVWSSPGGGGLGGLVVVVWSWVRIPAGADICVNNTNKLRNLVDIFVQVYYSLELAVGHQPKLDNTNAQGYLKPAPKTPARNTPASPGRCCTRLIRRSSTNGTPPGSQPPWIHAPHAARPHQTQREMARIAPKQNIR
ncbi:hypothetical protein MSG28_009547 [Choristoneura fumiferana]|uniref:Uncharacterized protein n=1 Tax=Choristoneura fumiferana TaxID=7141 RepID=A0ACC0JBN0_CHOFU|nr:hypothetical protein MSG28_009547 [Choristoneura fumiferana]